MPASVSIWIAAARPRTLPAAAMPVILGSSIAYYEDGFRLIPALLALGFALLIQVGTNYANDYFDFRKGADNETRIGPVRAVASGLIRPEAMRNAAAVLFAAAFVTGCGLIPYGGWWLLAVGGASILCGYLYTGGPYPLAYHGLGDIFVFAFFGIVAVMVTTYVQTGDFPVLALLGGCAMGALSTNLLVVNNFRDAETDRAAGKMTLAARFGRRFAWWEYYLLSLIALLIPILILAEAFLPWVLLPCFLWPWMTRLRASLGLARTAAEFGGVLKQTSLFLIAYGLLMSLGFILSHDLDLTDLTEYFNNAGSLSDSEE